MNDALRYLQAIVEHGNLSRAAASAYISQPALSRYITRIEDALDVRIIDRSAQPLVLTPAGHRYCDYLRGIEQLRAAMESDLDGMGDAGGESVRLGATTWRSMMLLPRVISTVLDATPDLRINLFEGSNSQLHNWVRSKKVDLAVMNAAQAGAGVHFEKVASESIVLAGRALLKDASLTGPAASGEEVPVARVKDVLQTNRLILMHPEHNLGAITRDFLLSLGVRNRRVINTNNVSTSIELGAEGVGLAFAPERAVLSTDGEVPHVQVRHPGLVQDLGLAWPLDAPPRGGTSDLADALRERIRTDFAEVNAPKLEA